MDFLLEAAIENLIEKKVLTVDQMKNLIYDIGYYYKHNFDVSKILAEINGTQLNQEEIIRGIWREKRLKESRNLSYVKPGRKSKVKEVIYSLKFYLKYYDMDNDDTIMISQIKETYNYAKTFSRATFYKFQKALRGNQLEEKIMKVLNIELVYMPTGYALTKSMHDEYVAEAKEEIKRGN